MFVLRTGITWRAAARGRRVLRVTCWRRLRGSAEAGGFTAVHELLLNQLRALDQLDCRWIDSAGSKQKPWQALDGTFTTVPWGCPNWFEEFGGCGV